MFSESHRGKYSCSSGKHASCPGSEWTWGWFGAVSAGPFLSSWKGVHANSAGQAWGTGCPDLGRTGGTFWKLSWARALGLVLPRGLGLRASLPSEAEAGRPSSWTLCLASCQTLALNADAGHLPGTRGHRVRAQPAPRRWRYPQTGPHDPTTAESDALTGSTGQKVHLCGEDCG